MIPLLCAALLAPLPQDEEPAGFPGLPVGHTPQVEIPWNRLYGVDELYGHLDRLVEAYPDLIERRILGRSIENRELRLYVIHDRTTGEDTDKPAMWIDGNVHGNEVQAGETVAYVAWYLLENHWEARLGNMFMIQSPVVRSGDAPTRFEMRVTTHLRACGEIFLGTSTFGAIVSTISETVIPTL